MEEENKQQFYQSFYSVIPTLLLEDEKIPLRAKKLYGLISNLCKKEGYCWASNKFLSEQSKIPIGTMRKHLKLLEKKDWIKSEVEPEEGNKRKIFLKLPDFTKYPMSTLTNKREQRGLSSLTNNREQRYVHAPEQKIPNNIIYNNNIQNIVGKADDVFLFKNKLDEMTKDKQKHIQIIALYWQIKGFNFENKEQYQAALKRELRPARQLVGYSMDRIRETIEWLSEETDINFKLETVHKYIDEDLDNIIPIKEKRNHH